MQLLAPFRVLLPVYTGLHLPSSVIRGGEIVTLHLQTVDYPESLKIRGSIRQPLPSVSRREWINIPDIRDFSDDLS